MMTKLLISVIIASMILGGCGTVSTEAEKSVGSQDDAVVDDVLPNVVLTMVPNNKSEFGFCVDEVRFYQDGGNIGDENSSVAENSAAQQSGEAYKEIVKYVPQENAELEARRQQVMQRLIAEAKTVGDGSAEKEKYSESELADVALEYYFFYGFKDETAIRQKLYMDGDENLYFHEIAIRYCRENGGAGIGHDRRVQRHDREAEEGKGEREGVGRAL